MTSYAEIETKVGGRTSADELVSLFSTPYEGTPDLIYLYFVVGDRITRLVDHLKLSIQERERVVADFAEDLCSDSDLYDGFAGQSLDELTSNFKQLYRALGLTETSLPQIVSRVSQFSSV